jgi:predicted DCC family thiol-disulfide oxidoreductase YuxK
VGQPVLLYDGLCKFCNGAVRFVLARDRDGRMRFAPLEGEFARQVLKEHPSLRDADSLILVEPGDRAPSPLVRSAAVLAIAHYLGWPWRAAAVLRLVPRAFRDWAYDLLARHRYRLFGRYDACPPPNPVVRARFIE